MKLFAVKFELKYYKVIEKFPKVAHFSMTSAGPLIFEPTELNEPAISRIYARINNKNKFSRRKKSIFKKFKKHSTVFQNSNFVLK
jgi:hypothetical protein